MTTVTEDLDLPSGVDPTGVVVTVYLAGEGGQPLPEAYDATTGKTIVGQHRLAPASDGTWSLDLAPNADLAPAGTVWCRTVSIAQPGGSPLATVPTTGGPYRWDEILADPPAALASAALSVHDFARDGWSGFTPEVMSVDGDQVFDAAVVDGRGRITGTQAGDGNHRVAYLRAGTDWADSEVRSVIWGPSDDWSGTNAQQGHLHRVREISPGVWEGIAVWTAVFGGDYSLLNTRAVRFDGVDLLQSGGDDATIGAAIDTIDRRVGVVAVLIGAFTTHWYRFTTPERLAHINNTGDTITVSGMSDDQFNHEDIAVDDVNNIPAGVIRVVGGSGTQGDWSFDGVGASPLITPTSRQRRWVPYTLATRVIGGDSSAATVEWMRWRPEDGPPDWGDPRVQRRDIATNANVPELPVGPGLCGLWGAHFHTGSYGEFGQLEFRQL